MALPFNLAGGLLAGYGIYDQYDRLGDLADDVVDRTGQIGQRAQSGTAFQPFTVASSIGGARGGPSGLAMDLSDPLQAQQDQLIGQSTGLFGQVTGMDQAAREQDVYDRIRATQLDEEERAQLAMQDRLAAQGRAGIRSNAFGGTPEELAYHKAVQESQNQASLMALQQAQAEQMQNAQLGGMLQTAAFLPTANLLNTINPALSIANMNQAGQIAGQNLATQLDIAGLTAEMNAERTRAELMANLFGTAGAIASNTNFDPIGEAAGGLFNYITNDILGI